MGMVMGVTAVIIGFTAALIGLVTWTALLFPRAAARVRFVLERWPGRCFLTGIAIALLLGLPVLLLLRSPHGHTKIAGWLLALPLVSLLALGLTGMAGLLGERMQQLSPALTPLGGLVRGALILVAASLLPFVGWFLFTPLVVLTVLGAGVMGGWPTGAGRQREEVRDDERTRDDAEEMAGALVASTPRLPSSAPPASHGSVLKDPAGETAGVA